MGYIYMYGMIMTTVSFRIDGEFPQADGYANIKERFYHLGGETGTAASILGNIGCSLVLGGTHLGNENTEVILGALKNMDVDTSKLVHEDYPGVTDYMVIAGDTRTGFGEWQSLYSRKPPFYEQPDEDAVSSCDVVGTDPFFGGKIVELCRRYNKKYAIIDCDYDSDFHRYSAVNAVSHEYLSNRYPDKSVEELYKLYTDNSDGLTIFTYGGGSVVYGRRGEPIHRFATYKVDVVSTLGAGDSFKAGTIYGLYKGMNDLDIVKYACATAGVACTKYPITYNPPTLSEIEQLIDKG